jgi:hypothetical protein
MHGPTLRCVVAGSFQPFLEALQGYEVISLTSMPAATSPPASGPAGGEQGLEPA